MTKILSLNQREGVKSDKNSSKRAPVRGRNRNNHVASSNHTTDARDKPQRAPSKPSRPSNDQFAQKPKSSRPYSSDRKADANPDERRSAPKSGERSFRDGKPSRPSSDSFEQKPKSSRPYSSDRKSDASPTERRASAKPGLSIQRHGKVRDGVREVVDGHVVRKPAGRTASTQHSSRPKHANAAAKPLRDERANPAKTTFARTESSSHSNADAPSGIRISKYLSDQGLCSRREADAYIEKGWVTVNGKRAELGQRVQPTDRVQLARQATLTQASRVTILINKPVGYVSGQAEDGYEPAVTLITAENQWAEAPFQQRFEFRHLKGLAPAGRLDIDSVGLLVLTQDGRVAKQLIGDDSDIDKEYLVRVEGELIANGLQLLNHGLELDGVPLRPAQVSWQNDDQLRFVLREGKKRQIRRMCELVGLKVVGLKRIRIGQVKLGNLPTGQWRYLTEDEQF